MAKKTSNETKQSKVDKMFYYVKTKDEKFVLCVGGYQVSKKKFDTVKQGEEYVATKPWNLLVNVCYLILMKKEHENYEKNPQDK